MLAANLGERRADVVIPAFRKWLVSSIARSPSVQKGIAVSENRELPLLKSARREAMIAASLWVATTVYCVTYCYNFGYRRNPESLTFVLGFPDWVFWGLIVPWATSTMLACLFAMFIMTDEDLDGHDPITDEGAAAIDT